MSSIRNVGYVMDEQSKQDYINIDNQPQNDDSASYDATAEIASLDASNSSSHSLEQAKARFEELLTAMQSLRYDFDTKVKYDQSKERLIESLHRELQIYRDGLHFRILRPLFLDLITLYDDVSKVIENLHQNVALTESYQVGQHLDSFREMIEEILVRNSVTPFTLQEDTFVPAKQRTIKTVATTDPLYNKYIARRVRVGFEYEGTILRPEMVEVYKYTPTSEK